MDLADCVSQRHREPDEGDHSGDAHRVKLTVPWDLAKLEVEARFSTHCVENAERHPVLMNSGQAHEFRLLESPKGVDLVVSFELRTFLILVPLKRILNATTNDFDFSSSVRALLGPGVRGRGL